MKPIIEKFNLNHLIVDEIIFQTIPQSNKYESIIYYTLSHPGFIFKQFEENDRTIYRMGITLDNGRIICVVDVNDLSKQVITYIHCLSSVPPQQMDFITEFIIRANGSLNLGHFELDHSNGDIQYRSSFFYNTDFQLGDDIFKRNFFASCSVMDKYLPGLMEVIYSKVAPSDAIAQIDNCSNQEYNVNWVANN